MALRSTSDDGESFRERFNNHKNLSNDPSYQNENELSKYVWKRSHNDPRSMNYGGQSLSARFHIAVGTKCHQSAWKKRCAS